jgi:hypothetical protein
VAKFGDVPTQSVLGSAVASTAACKVIRTTGLAISAGTTNPVTFPTGQASEVYKTHADFHSMSSATQQVFTVIAGWTVVKCWLIFPADSSGGSRRRLVVNSSLADFNAIKAECVNGGTPNQPLTAFLSLRFYHATYGPHRFDLSAYSDAATTVTGGISIRTTPL